MDVSHKWHPFRNNMMSTLSVRQTTHDRNADGRCNVSWRPREVCMHAGTASLPVMLLLRVFALDGSVYEGLLRHNHILLLQCHPARMHGASLLHLGMSMTKQTACHMHSSEVTACCLSIPHLCSGELPLCASCCTGTATAQLAANTKHATTAVQSAKCCTMPDMLYISQMPQHKRNKDCDQEAACAVRLQIDLARVVLQG